MEVTPQQIPAAKSALDKVSVDPRVITGYLLSVMQWKFGSIENIGSAALRKSSMLYTPDDTVAEQITTGVLIDTVLRYDPIKAQMRPAILVGRNDAALGPRQSIGDRRHTPTALIGTVDANFSPTLGHNQQELLIGGSHSIFCISREGSASEELGLEVWHTLMDFMAIIRQDLRLMEFRVGPLQKTGKLAEFHTNWVTPVTVTYKYSRSTVIRLESPVLKAISVSGPEFNSD